MNRTFIFQRGIEEKSTAILLSLAEIISFFADGGAVQQIFLVSDLEVKERHHRRQSHGKASTVC